jgi:hypothetical protein
MQKRLARNKYVYLDELEYYICAVAESEKERKFPLAKETLLHF